MNNRRERYDRKIIRLPHYDYCQPGVYFVTLVAHGRACLFGEVREGKVLLSAMGELADRVWCEIPNHFPGVTVDDYVIMPNHVHGMIVINDDVGARYISPLRRPTLGLIVGTFKAAVTREIHRVEGFGDRKIWQRNYYERVIRDEKEYQKIQDYIEANPANWEQDSEYR